MNKQDLRRLSRQDLLEMLLDLTRENEQLRKTVRHLEEALQDRTITALESGSLAEAALRLNEVFQAAQKASDQYVFNMQQRCQQMEEQTKRQCEQMLAQVSSRARQYEKENHN